MVPFISSLLGMCRVSSGKFSCVSVVQVRYQNVTVEVVEGEERVVLALIVSGELQRSVHLIISTRDGSATGE